MAPAQIPGTTLSAATLADTNGVNAGRRSVDSVIVQPRWASELPASAFPGLMAMVQVGHGIAIVHVLVSMASAAVSATIVSVPVLAG